MKSESDIKEVIDFINASDYSGKGISSDKCLGYLSEDIDEEFLIDRGNEFKKAYDENEDFKNSIEKLSSICDGKKTCTGCSVNKYCNHYIKSVRENVNESSLKMIDLFCGAGGLSLGFTQEGFITSLANDIQECCVDTYAEIILF